MSGWSFFCVYSNYGSESRTAAARLNVLAGVQAQNAPAAITYVNCPICGELISSTAAVCPFCDQFVNGDAAGAANTGEPYFHVDEQGNGVYIDSEGAIIRDANNKLTYYMGTDGRLVGVDDYGNIVEEGTISLY